MFYNILDKKRKEILPLLKEFKNDFYLAGGTGLALQIGHRDSIDFDFFTKNDIDTEKLFQKIKKIFENYQIQKIQDEKNTLTVIINNDIKLSFFTYDYKILDDFIEDENLKIAAIKDIATMKISAIMSRSTEKDYIDLYFIFQNNSLNDVLFWTQEKFNNTLSEPLILKSLVYFDDIISEPINFKNNKNTKFEDIKKFLVNLIKQK